MHPAISVPEDPYFRQSPPTDDNGEAGDVAFARIGEKRVVPATPSRGERRLSIKPKQSFYWSDDYEPAKNYIFVFDTFLKPPIHPKARVSRHLGAMFADWDKTKPATHVWPSHPLRIHVDAIEAWKDLVADEKFFSTSFLCEQQAPIRWIESIGRRLYSFTPERLETPFLLDYRNMMFHKGGDLTWIPRHEPTHLATGSYAFFEPIAYFAATSRLREWHATFLFEKYFENRPELHGDDCLAERLGCEAVFLTLFTLMARTFREKCYPRDPSQRDPGKLYNLYELQSWRQNIVVLREYVARIKQRGWAPLADESKPFDAVTNPVVDLEIVRDREDVSERSKPSSPSARTSQDSD